jgi:hypothetical protein
VAAKLAHTLAHSLNANAGAVRLYGGQLFRGHAAAMIPYFDKNIPRIGADPNFRRFASGMAVDIGETLLHDAKYR